MFLLVDGYCIIVRFSVSMLGGQQDLVIDMNAAGVTAGVSSFMKLGCFICSYIGA